jgi:hypothetical protein
LIEDAARRLAVPASMSATQSDSPSRVVAENAKCFPSRVQPGVPTVRPSRVCAVIALLDFVATSKTCSVMRCGVMMK